MAAQPEPVALAKGSLARTEGVGTLGEGMGRRGGGLTGRRSGRELDRGEGSGVGEEGMMRVRYWFKTLIICFCCFWRLLRRSHPSLGRWRCLERNEKGGVRLISATIVSSVRPGSNSAHKQPFLCLPEGRELDLYSRLMHGQPSWSWSM